MTIEYLTLGVVVALTLSISLLVETSSWSIRVYAAEGSIGTYIARTNMYLYGGRLFAVLTQVVIGFLVDQGANPFVVLKIFLGSFAAASISHGLIFGRKKARLAIEFSLLRLMRFDEPSTFSPFEGLKDRNLFLATTASATIFSLALMAPLVLASVFPDYRLTLNNAGSLINLLGMLVLLGYLDPLMYRALDEGSISDKIDSYLWGRAAGFLICAMMLCVFLLVS